jgi:predicted AAA+ superfamily ATPase
MMDANLIYRSDYYDVKGKKILETSGRYYSVDLGIRNINAKFNSDRGFSLENVVFLQFKRLGYEVYGNKLNNGSEIDFVVENKLVKNSVKYIQVTERITKSNMNSEIGNLLMTAKNSFEKIVISQYDPSEIRTDGVRIINLID